MEKYSILRFEIAIQQHIGSCDLWAFFSRFTHPLHLKGTKDGTLYKIKKNRKPFDFRRILVEVTGFEPATFWSRTKRATKLRYTSRKVEPMKGLEPLTC